MRSDRTHAPVSKDRIGSTTHANCGIGPLDHSSRCDWLHGPSYTARRAMESAQQATAQLLQRGAAEIEMTTSGMGAAVLALLVAGGLAAAVPSSLVALAVALVFLIGTRIARVTAG